VRALLPLKLRADAAPRVIRPLYRLRLAGRLRPLLAQVDRYREMVAARHLRGDGEDPVQPPASAPRPPWTWPARSPRGRATLAFLVLPDRTVVFVARGRRLDLVVSPVTRVELRERVSEWHEHVRDATGSEVLRRMGRRLAERLGLLRVLESLPAAVHALTVVPDDVLHGFPFAALVHQDRYLVERWPVHVAFRAQPGQEPTRGDPVRSALLLGVRDGAGQFGLLAGVQREMEWVDGWLRVHGVEPRRLDDAYGPGIRDAVLAELSSAHLAHLACHGVFQPDAPDRSGLVVRPAERPVHEEVLSLRDLARADLAAVRHVTLSSCWSADSFVLPGRWVISLPETLWRAGAGSVLGSLWEVDDEVAVFFTGAFYERLSGLPRDRALQEVQRLCLRGELPGCGDVDTRDPFFWAGFQLYGNPGDLRLPERG
jgi:CHAT domain-containing protein